MSGREKNAHFRAHYLFLPKTFLDRNSEIRKNYKNCGFSGNCPKPKMTPFVLKKVFFEMVENLGFTNCVFEKLCSSENTIFIVFSAKHSSCNKSCMLRNRKCMKDCGLFLNMAKWCFLGLFFVEVLMVLWFVFVWYSCKGVKNAWFPLFGGFCVVAYYCLFGFGRFR